MSKILAEFEVSDAVNVAEARMRVSFELGRLRPSSIKLVGFVSKRKE